MTKFWVLVDFTVGGTPFSKGQAVNLEEDYVTRDLVRYGIISTTKPDGVIG